MNKTLLFVPKFVKNHIKLGKLALVLALLLIGGQAWGALIADDDAAYTHAFVDTDSGNDTTGNGAAWATAWATLGKAETANKNLVTQTKGHVIHLRGTAADASKNIEWDGWTTSTLYRIIIQGDAISGVWDATKYRLEMTAAAPFDRIIYPRDDYIELRNLQMFVDNSASNHANIFHIYTDATAHNLIVLDCVFKGAGTAYNDACVYMQDAGSLTVINTLFYDMRYGLYIIAGTVNVLNSNFINCLDGVNNQSGTPSTYLYNNVFFGNTTDIRRNVALAGGSGNALASDKLGNAYPYSDVLVYNVAATDFLNYAGKDFRPSATSVLRNKGGGAVAGAYAFDITGAARPSAAAQWDLGYYELPWTNFTNVSPADNGIAYTAQMLTAAVDDTGSNNSSVQVWGRAIPANSDDFTFVVIPDTQYYAKYDDAGFQDGTCNDSTPKTGLAVYLRNEIDWILANYSSYNVKAVLHLGDLTQTDRISAPANGVSDEWCWVDHQFDRLEAGLPDNIVITATAGNHDMTPINTGSTTNYNSFFGTARWSGYSWYGGGHEGSGADAYYVIFTAGGVDFIVINLKYAPSADQLTWASALLQSNLTKFGIVVTHGVITTGGLWATVAGGDVGLEGESVYDALKASAGATNTNLRMILCGHNYGEATKTVTYDGTTTKILLSDYQEFGADKGKGIIRLMTWKPSQNKVVISTVSTSDAFTMTDSESSFEIDIEDFGAFTQIGSTQAGVADAATVYQAWDGLDANASYQWRILADNTYQTTEENFDFITSWNGTWYVNSVSGSDAAAGTSQAEARATITPLALLLMPGHSLNLSGDFSTETFDLSSSSITGTLLITGAFKLNKIIGNANVNLIGTPGSRIIGPIDLGNTVKLQAIPVTKD